MLRPEEYLNQLVAADALDEIKLGLERTEKVWHKLKLTNIPFTYIVGGTNGKGSCSALLERALRCHGENTGLICSPHLMSFNERVCINGTPATDDEWLSALRYIKDIKGQIPLTYFEYCTLAAFVIFAKHNLDVWILEVGLGGRLDAVNVVDADCAVLTSIGLDHTEILGDTREKIAYEKLAIARAGKHLVVGETQLPENFIQLTDELGANMLLINRDFGYKGSLIADKSLAIDGATFRAHTGTAKEADLTMTSYDQPMVASNIASVWQALNLYCPKDYSGYCSGQVAQESDKVFNKGAKSSSHSFKPDAEKTSKRTSKKISRIWQEFTLAGRWQKLPVGNSTLIMDSGHNPAASEMLALMLEEELSCQGVKEGPKEGIKEGIKEGTKEYTKAPTSDDSTPKKKVAAILSMLSNKDWLGFMQPLLPLVDMWHIFSLETPKGLPATEMQQRILELGILPSQKILLHKDASQLIDNIFQQDTGVANTYNADIFLVCGSFHTVGEIMTQLKQARFSNVL